MRDTHTGRLPWIGAALAAAACLFALLGVGQSTAAAPLPAHDGQAVQQMTLDDCLRGAMEGNHRRKASKFAVVMAEAQHRQALAGYWPQVSGKAGYVHMNEGPDFLFPASSVNVPGGTAIVTVPAGVLGPTAVQLPVTTPAERLPVPAQDVKLIDPDTVLSSLNVTWLLYDGGMRAGYRDQGQGLVDMMKEEARRTDLEVADSVKRLYYGAVLARQLHQLGDDTLARMEATLNLTETMYKEGSGRVKKTDFLDSKVVVETIRTMVAELEKNEDMAQAALANTLGLPWNAAIEPVDKELAFVPYGRNLDRLVGTAYQFNPDWGKVAAGIRASEGAVRTARSEYCPKLALTGEMHTWWNNYDAGLATPRDKSGWSVGVGLEIPLFSGFLTRNRVAEALARVDKVKEEQILLKEGLGLQVKGIFLGLKAAQKSHQSTLDAMKAAVEDRDLNTRAYQNELVETEKVIRAQLMEALMTAQHYKTCYDHLALQSSLALVVGTQVLNQLKLQ